MIGAVNEQYFHRALATTDWIDLFPWESSVPLVSITEGNASTGFGTFYEWGNSSISNSGSYSWRTPSITELNYIPFDRPNALQKFGGATAAGVDGLIILPDLWVQLSGFTFNPNRSLGFKTD